MQSAGSEVEASINRRCLAVRGGPRSPAPPSAWKPLCFLSAELLFSARWPEQVESSLFQHHHRLNLLTLFTRSKSVSATTPAVAHRLSRSHLQTLWPTGLDDKWCFKLHVEGLTEQQLQSPSGCFLEDTIYYTEVTIHIEFKDTVLYELWN